VTRVSANRDGYSKITVSPSTKGAISEHIATAWLMANGYDVFRNVSPNGRADILAVDWEKDETIRVDVKSEGFSLVPGVGNRASITDNIETDRQNQGFNIRYLVVMNDGSCGWYSADEPVVANDNTPPPRWWIDTKSGQRFTAPGYDMSGKEWSYFCHWLVRAYHDYIVPFSEDFVRSISSRGIGARGVSINEREFVTLNKLRSHIVQKLTDAGSIQFRDI